MVVQAEKQRLVAQRAKLHSLLSPMSPIRRLSNEVLLHIFEYVCEENLLQSYPWFSDRRPLIELISPVITYLPTMAISSVCSRWRVLALSSPSLWANIKVEMYTPAGEKATALVGFVDTVARFLERSGNWPLSLSLYMEGIPSYETGQPPLTFLTQHARRWKTFMYRGDCLLTKCPSVKSLGLVGWEDYDLESSTHYMSRNITSLTIMRDYDSYLELVLLTFNLPSLNTIVLDM
ncbi:hypothetical protein BDP27DRAFT_435015 [Rhodocollybia butyracea]|uniref:F-box domain-containing protein n=1 Tax=Rhodocollybia butyracea TaxID=206335 RepID=A0A9P5Q259_9AGAR|nr:hypothetical protein BDP27DRAFT_435015 [Rhodocollybia butyracea]